MKAHGKGKGISLTDEFTNKVNKFKQVLANVSEGVPIRPWKPYMPSRAMQAASARAAEVHKIPSLVH